MDFSDDVIAKAKKIKLLILDVDGVMTNNQLHYSDDGYEMKSFYTRDGHGMVMLQQSNVEIGVITGRKSPLVGKRMSDLKIKHVHQGVPDKLPTFLKLVSDLNIHLDEIAYIGDDILDLPILTRVGLASTPADGEAEVKSRVDYVSEFSGGRGCVREMCELIMKAQGSWQKQMDFYLRKEL